MEIGELVKQVAAMSPNLGMPKPRAGAVINITEIHSLKPCTGAAKKIA